MMKLPKTSTRISEEHKALISAANKGKPKSEKTKARMRISNREFWERVKAALENSGNTLSVN